MPYVKLRLAIKSNIFFYNIGYAIFLNSSSTTISGYNNGDNNKILEFRSFPDGRSKGIYNNTDT